MKNVSKDFFYKIDAGIWPLSDFNELGDELVSEVKGMVTITFPKLKSNFITITRESV